MEGCCFVPENETIVVGNPPTELDDDELHLFYGDVVTHEFIHYLLYKMFDNNETISILFDTIESHFRLPESQSVREKTYGNSPYATQWKSWIDMWGFDEFLNLYGITNFEYFDVSIQTMFRKLDGLNVIANKIKYKLRLNYWKLIK